MRHIIIHGMFHTFAHFLCTFKMSVSILDNLDCCNSCVQQAITDKPKTWYMHRIIFLLFWRRKSYGWVLFGVRKSPYTNDNNSNFHLIMHRAWNQRKYFFCLEWEHTRLDVESFVYRYIEAILVWYHQELHTWIEYLRWYLPKISSKIYDAFRSNEWI